MVGREVTVYDRYLFAVPVKGIITAVSDKDGAYCVKFYSNNPGGVNVTQYDGSYFFTEQCRLSETEAVHRNCEVKVFNNRLVVVAESKVYTYPREVKE